MKLHTGRGPLLLPRLIRVRDAPAYLGMDRGKFNALVRPHLTEIPLGSQALAFDRLELGRLYRVQRASSEGPKTGGRRMAKRNRMPGLRKKGGIWQIEKRCKWAEGGWLRESTGTASRMEAEKYLIRRLAELEEEARRQAQGVYTFEEAAFRYLEEVAGKSSADTIAMHLDQLFPFIGKTPLEQTPDGTLKPFIDHERKRGLSPKSINALGVDGRAEQGGAGLA